MKDIYFMDNDEIESFFNNNVLDSLKKYIHHKSLVCFFLHKSDCNLVEKILHNHLDYQISFIPSIDDLYYFIVDVDIDDYSQNALYHKIFDFLNPLALNGCNIKFVAVCLRNSKWTIIGRWDLSGISGHFYREDLKAVFKSSWEANIARIFNHIKVEWKYEWDSFERYDLKDSDKINGYYYPDFLINNNIVVEVKGFWNPNSRNKAMEFVKNYQDYQYYVIDHDIYYSLKKKYQSQLSNWEEDGTKSSDSEMLQVVGLSFGNRKQTVKTLIIGQSVILKRDINNKFDSNAILVLTNNNSEIGFISADWAVIYAPKLDLGMTFDAEIKSIEPKVINIKVKRNNLEQEIVYNFLK